MAQFDDLEVNTLLDRLPGQLVAVLSDKLVGLYLYGSLVTGDYDPGLSDVDLLAVLTAPLTDAEFQALDALHAELVRAQPVWDDRLEIAYLPADALRNFREVRSPLGIISPGEPFNAKDAGSDWLMNWYLVRTMGQTLYGPPPAQLIGLIGLDEFVQSVQDHARSWPDWIESTRNDAHYQAYAVLTLCRTLYTTCHGEHVSKQRAAQWVAETWPPWAELAQRSLAWRALPTVHVDPRATFPQAKAFLDFVVRWLAQNTASSGSVYRS